MPTVPVYNSPQVGDQPLPSVRMDGPSPRALAQGEIGAVEQQRLGHALGQYGEEQAHEQIDAQNIQNTLRVDDGANAVRQAAQDLLYDPNSGVLAQKGAAALKPNADGQSLPDAYAQKLRDKIDEVSANLGNDAQRQQFQRHANDMLASFKGTAEAHLLQESKTYGIETQKGTIELSTNAAKLAWNNPDEIGRQLDSVKAANWKMGQLQGLPANMVEANERKLTSGVHSDVVVAALENNQPGMAFDYLGKHSQEMTADDILKMTKAVDMDIGARQAVGAAQVVVKSLQSQVQPTDMDRLTNIVQGMESNGNPNAVGKNVPGQGTAKGDMQVMDATNGAPGYGVPPAKDNSKEERSRVGRDYLAAMVQKYGDPAKAMAAYNAGPGALDAAVSQAKDGNWLALMPKETQAYVHTGMAKFGSGQGSPTMPTLQQVHDGIRQQLPTAAPKVLELALQEGTRQYEDMVKAQKQQGDQALGDAQRYLIANGGNIASLPPSLKMRVAQYAPDKMDNLATFAKAIGAPDQATNMAAYNTAITYPESLAKMSDAEFQAFQMTNFSKTDQEKVAKLRADQLNGATDDSTGAINSKAFNTVVSNRLTSIGINPTPDRKDTKAQQQVGTIKKFLTDDIYEQQTHLGRKMTPQEIGDRVDTLFMKSLDFKNTLFGFQTGTSDQTMLTMKAGDIPDQQRKDIMDAFARRGIVKPTDDQVLRTYWMGRKNAKQ